VERFEQPYQLNAECALVDYVRNTNGSFTFRAQYQTNDFVVDPVGTGLFSHPNQKPKPAKMRVAFLGTQEETNYQVLDTDYTHFAIIYNCEPVSAGKSYQSYWLLSRKPKLTKDPAVLERIEAVKKQYIDPNHIRKTIQSKKL
jgi:apolipoprotein D and lipocalin family protein